MNKILCPQHMLGQLINKNDSILFICYAGILINSSSHMTDKVSSSKLYFQDISLARFHSD